MQDLKVVKPQVPPFLKSLTAKQLSFCSILTPQVQNLSNLVQAIIHH